MLSYSSGSKKPKIRLSGIKPRFLQDYPSSRASEKGCGNCRYFSVTASLFRPDLAFHCPISFLPLRLWSHHLCWLWPSCTALISDLFGSLGPIQIGQDNFSNSRSWAKAQLQIPFCSTKSSALWGLGIRAWASREGPPQIPTSRGNNYFLPDSSFLSVEHCTFKKLHTCVCIYICLTDK